MDSSGRADGGKDTNVSRAFQILEEATRAGPLSQKTIGQFRNLAIGSCRRTSKITIICSLTYIFQQSDNIAADRLC